MGAAKVRAECIERAERAVFDAMDIDRAWFEAHSERSTYIRPALREEIELHHLVHGWPIDPGPGLRWFSVVRQVAPGLRCRQCSYTDPASGAIPGESYACHVWNDFNRQSGGALLRFEADLRRELTPDGRTVH